MSYEKSFCRALTKSKRLRSYVLTCFHRLRTFAFQNLNVSKNGDKRNGDTGPGRKTV